MKTTMGTWNLKQKRKKENVSGKILTDLPVSMFYDKTAIDFTGYAFKWNSLCRETLDGNKVFHKCRENGYLSQHMF